MLGGWFFMSYEKMCNVLSINHKNCSWVVCVRAELLKGNVYLKVCLCFRCCCAATIANMLYLLYRMYAHMKCGASNGREKRQAIGNANFEWEKLEKNIRKTGTQIIGRQSKPLLISSFSS